MDGPTEFALSSCGGKFRFPVRLHATWVARKKNRSKKCPDGLHYDVYRCKVCAGWHVGSSKTVDNRGHKKLLRGRRGSANADPLEDEVD